MANNKVYEAGQKLYLPVEAGSVSGSPVAVGSRCGVALLPATWQAARRSRSRECLRSR